MDVSSVSSSTNVALATSIQTQLRARQAEQNQPPQSTQESQQAQQAKPTQGTEQATPGASSSEREARAVAEAEKSRPTVNINGQTVGTRVNTTA